MICDIIYIIPLLCGKGSRPTRSWFRFIFDSRGFAFNYRLNRINRLFGVYYVYPFRAIIKYYRELANTVAHTGG
jgi:hypothetical protein